MKNFLQTICGLALIIGLIALGGIGGAIESHYKLEGTVVSVVRNIVTIEDKNGEFWEYEKIEDCNLHAGAKVEMLMFDNHTSKIYDDEIIKVKIK